MSNVVAYQISAQSEHLKKIVSADASADTSADTPADINIRKCQGT